MTGLLRDLDAYGPLQAPRAGTVHAELATHPVLGAHAVAGRIVVGTASGAAVVLDTETTRLDGVLVEVAVLDAATGEVLLESLVRPEEPISAGAQLLHLTRGRTVIAYNAEFDQARLLQHADRDRLDLAHLAGAGVWECLMLRRSDWAMRPRWMPLHGGHRAGGDCRVAVELLAAMTTPYGRGGRW
ncbi:MAG: 3'-5' exonuclease [Actinomycetales bacterium]|nr:3'-5' exonuclease [Actinomycetales bacterium]